MDDQAELDDHTDPGDHTAQASAQAAPETSGGGHEPGPRSPDPAPDVVADLEGDIASVASALETIDRIVAGDNAGPSAAEEIGAVVSAERFQVVEPGHPHA